jgi:hypothetical protein
MAASLIAVVVLPGCLEFESIEQPSSILPGELFTVRIEVTVEETGGYPIFGIRLPVGWTIPGDTIAYAGILQGSLVHDPDVSLEQENLDPAPAGYSWWLGAGASVEEANAGTVFADVPIQADVRPGRYSLTYLLDSGGGPKPSHKLSDAEGSDHHIIEVADEWTPRELHALSWDRSVVLTWLPPLEQGGLAGYRVYRDGQPLNTEPLTDSAYSDPDLPGGVFHYSVSSLYENGDEHVTPYEVKAIAFSGGAGEPNDPYQIALSEQLVAIAGLPDLLDRHFVLKDHVDLDPNLHGARVFNKAVIPTFSGTFDGQGYTIRHLAMKAGESASGPLGLFGVLESSGQVRDLGITDADVTGSDSHIAGLVGRNYGAVHSCHVTGVVVGSNSCGGLAGWNGGSIATSYSNSFVSGENAVGGLAA